MNATTSADNLLNLAEVKNTEPVSNSPLSDVPPVKQKNMSDKSDMPEQSMTVKMARLIVLLNKKADRFAKRMGLNKNDILVCNAMYMAYKLRHEVRPK